MLIRRAELEGGRIADVRIERGRIAAIGAIGPRPGEPVLDARGGLLLPGLHDHHIHVAALAAAFASVPCGPPEVEDADSLAERLRQPGDGWLRGIGYHESVAGLLDRCALDRMAGNRPVRIQHRTGRMWFLNSAALDRLLEQADPPPGLDRETGRLFDEDDWLRRTLGAAPPDFGEVGRRLARAGVTGISDLSPANDRRMAQHFATEQARGTLPQTVLLAGRLTLATDDMGTAMRLGPAKLHLHDAALPALDEAVAFARAAHAAGRGVAVHCVTAAELWFALAMFDEAGGGAGDRIEHASIAGDEAVERIAELGLAVVAQPHFIAERGDAYRRDVEPDEQPLLYRLRSLLDAGITLAGGSDAPYGGIDPWAAMAAAVSRRTPSGAMIGAGEALTPEQALDLYLRDPEALAQRRRIVPGASADLCLLAKPWAEVRHDLSSEHVRAVFVEGRRIDDRVDQAPA